jgi:hypothetical protein
MAWNPKTKFGKIVQGALKAGASVLSVVGGGTIVGAAATAAGKLVSKGTTVLTKAQGTLNNIKVKSDAVKESAKNLVTGYTAEVNAMNTAAKDQLRSQIASATDADTYINEDGIEVVGKKPFNLKEFIASPVGLGVAALAAFFILPKILKK